MINVYNDADFFASYQEKRRALRLFFLITGIYLALGITILVYLTTLPYGDPNSGWPKAIVYVVMRSKSKATLPLHFPCRAASPQSVPSYTI